MCSAIAYSPSSSHFVLVFQVEAKHFFRLLRDFDRHGRHGRLTAQVVDLLGDVNPLRALDGLGIIDVGDDRRYSRDKS